MVYGKMGAAILLVLVGALAFFALNGRVDVLQLTTSELAVLEQPQAVSPYVAGENDPAVNRSNSANESDGQDSRPVLEIVSIGDTPAEVFRGTAKYEDDPMTLTDDTESRRSAFVFEPYIGAPEILVRADSILLAGRPHKNDGAGWLALTADYSEVVPVLVVIDREVTADRRTSFDNPTSVYWKAVPVDSTKRLSEIIFRGLSVAPGMTDAVPKFSCAAMGADRKSDDAWFAQCNVTHRGRRLGLHLRGNASVPTPGFGDGTPSYTEFKLDVDGVVVPIGVGTLLESLNDINRDGYPDFWIYIAESDRPGVNSMVVSQADGGKLLGYNAAFYVNPSCSLDRRDRFFVSLHAVKRARVK